MSGVAKRPELSGLPGKVTEVSLTYHEGTDYEEWCRSLELLGRFGQGLNFWIGDAINQGEAMYGERYAQAIDLLGLATQTAMNIAYTCRQIAPNRRKVGLSFSHHAEVAPLSPSLQSRFLKLAVEGDALPAGGRKPWSVKTLRAAIQTHRKDDEPCSPTASSTSRSGTTSKLPPAASAAPAATAEAAPVATRTIDRLTALENLARAVKRILDNPKAYYAQPTLAIETLGQAYALLETST